MTVAALGRQKRYAHRPVRAKGLHGFSLLEVAVVLVILGLLIGSLITPLSAQRENKQRAKATTELAEIKAAILGYVLINGRFPCPASLSSNGIEARNTGSGVCTSPNGYVPMVTLGISGTSTGNNLLSDPWIQPYRYSLTGVNSWEYSNAVSINSTAANIQVCTATSCAASEILTSTAVAVIFSTAKSGAPTATSSLEQENTDSDTLFIKASESEATGAEFDDLIIWLNQNELAYALAKAGFGS